MHGVTEMLGCLQLELSIVECRLIILVRPDGVVFLLNTPYPNYALIMCCCCVDAGCLCIVHMSLWQRDGEEGGARLRPGGHPTLERRWREGSTRGRPGVSLNRDVPRRKKEGNAR